MFRQPYMCMSQHFPLPMFDRYIFLFVCSICVIPQVAKLLELLLQAWEGLHVCVLEGACKRRSRVLLSEWYAPFGAGMLVPLQDATAGCCCQSGVRALGRTPAQWPVRFGAGMLVLLQSVATGSLQGAA